MEYRVIRPLPGADVAILEVRGDLDLETVPRLDEALAGTPLEDLVVDLSSAGFMDSTGIGFLIRLWRRRRSAGRRLVVAGLSPLHTRILTVAGVARWLDATPTVAEALDRLGGLTAVPPVLMPAPPAFFPAPLSLRKLRPEG